MTRNGPIVGVITLAIGAALLSTPPALAASVPPASHEVVSAAGEAACYPYPPSGDGWRTTGDILYGSCAECADEAYLYEQLGAQTHCESQASGIHQLWIRL